MKKIHYRTTLLLFVLFSALTFTGCHTQEQPPETTAAQAFPELKDRDIPSAGGAEIENMLNTYEQSVAEIRKDSANMGKYIDLAAVYMTMSRLTGDNVYYDNAAMKMLKKVANSPESSLDNRFVALSYQSAVLLSMHQFPDALEAAQKAVAINDKNAGIYGALVDAHVELGHYEEAVKMCDKMMAIRPDLRSYSRASYLRQIHGDNQGAIEAMNMAVKAGYPGAEPTEWARVVLAELLLQTGDYYNAGGVLDNALAYRPAYPYAEIGMARVQKAKGNYDQAIRHTGNAIRTMGQPAFILQLADLYELKGDLEKAGKIRRDVVQLLEEAEAEQAKNALVRHHGKRELAIAYMKSGNLDQALSSALTDLETRPDNIDANELVAWIYFLRGDYGKALIHADKMLVTNVKDGEKLYKAGLIYQRAGEPEKGKVLLAEAESISPYLDPLVKKYGEEGMAMN